MKKLLYTLSLVTLFGVAGKAQSHEPAKQQDPKKPATAAPTTAPEQDQPKSRMAITQKGIPAAKTKDMKEKDAKATEPKGQPTATEKH